MDSNVASSAPLHVQVAERIRRAVGAGEFGPGQRLPSESELSRRLEVSRGTLRQALGALARDGLLETVSGRGTFVRQAGPAASGCGRLIGMVIPAVARL